MKYEQPMLTSFIMSATILWMAELIKISGYVHMYVECSSHLLSNAMPKREVMTKHLSAKKLGVNVND